MTDHVIYQATVMEKDTQNKQSTEKYVGLASTTFKERYGGHKLSFENKKYSNETTLSTHIWKLKGRGSTFNIKWKIIDRGQSFNPATKICQLCTKEKFYILFKPEMSTLNSRNELGAHCRHKKTSLVGSVKVAKSSRPRGTN